MHSAGLLVIFLALLLSPQARAERPVPFARSSAEAVADGSRLVSDALGLLAADCGGKEAGETPAVVGDDSAKPLVESWFGLPEPTGAALSFLLATCFGDVGLSRALAKRVAEECQSPHHRSPTICATAASTVADGGIRLDPATVDKIQMEADTELQRRYFSGERILLEAYDGLQPLCEVEREAGAGAPLGWDSPSASTLDALVELQMPHAINDPDVWEYWRSVPHRCQSQTVSKRNRRLLRRLSRRCEARADLEALCADVSLQIAALPEAVPPTALGPIFAESLAAITAPAAAAADAPTPESEP